MGRELNKWGSDCPPCFTARESPLFSVLYTGMLQVFSAKKRWKIAIFLKAQRIANPAEKRGVSRAGFLEEEVLEQSLSLFYF